MHTLGSGCVFIRQHTKPSSWLHRLAGAIRFKSRNKGRSSIAAHAQPSKVEESSILPAREQSSQRFRIPSNSSIDSPGEITRGHETVELFIDGDHIGPSAFKPILSTVGRLGNVLSRRAYVHEHTAEIWKNEFKALEIEPVVVPRTLGGAKDPVDLAVTWDVAASAHGAAATTIAIASEDLDFSIIHQQVRKQGLRSYAILRDRGGGPHSHIANSLRQYVDDVLYYKLGKGREINYRLVLDCNNLSKPMTREDGFVDVPDHSEEIHELFSFLEGLDYVVRQTRNGIEYSRSSVCVHLLLAALAKFYHVHRLGCLSVSPISAMVKEGHAVMKSPRADPWIRHPGGLIFMQPWRSPSLAVRKEFGIDSRASHVASCGGPFLMTITDNLVENVLRRMGYIESSDVLTHEALDLFCDLNTKPLRVHDFTLGDCLSANMARLHDTFASQDYVQRWRAAYSDGGVRNLLNQHKLIRSPEEASSVIFEAMGEFLKQFMKASCVPTTYALRVARINQHLRAQRPDARK